MKEIESLIAAMVKEGVSPELIGRTAQALADLAGAFRGDAQAERRRAADRARKAGERLRNSAESADSPPEVSKVSQTLPNLPNQPLPKDPPKGVQKVSEKRGSRLPDDWKPSPALEAYAMDQGIPPEAVGEVFEGLKRWAYTTPGAKARKLDWNLFAQGWARREADKLGARGPPRFFDRQPYRSPLD